MDQQTVELMRLLQQGTHDSATWARIEAALPGQRQHLVQAGRPAELGDLADLLESWSAAAPLPHAIAAALHAATIAGEDLAQDERAIALYQLCLERDRTEFEPYHRLEALLQRRGEHERLEAILSAQAEEMRARADIDSGLTANAYQRLGQLKAEHGRIDGAIEAYEQALALAPDNETLSELAAAYHARGTDSDLRQAADLYCALGDVLGEVAGRSMLERALDLVPDHDDALDALEAVLSEDEQAQQLQARWEAYVARSSNTEGVEKRRHKLQQAQLGGELAESDREFTLEAAKPYVAPAGARQLHEHAANGSALAAAAGDEHNGRIPPPAPHGSTQDREWDPETLVGIGRPATLESAVASGGVGASAVSSGANASSDVKVPPLFSGRPPAPNTSGQDDSGGSDAEYDSEWPEQLALGENSAPASGIAVRAPLFSASQPVKPPHADVYDDDDGTFSSLGASSSPRPLHSSSPSYSFQPPASSAQAFSGRSPRRWVLPLGGAIVLGISAGVAIAFGLSSSGKQDAGKQASTTASAVAASAVPKPADVTAPPPGAPAPPAELQAVPPAQPAPPAEGGNPVRVETAAKPAAVTASEDAGEVKVAAKQVKVRGGLTAREVASTLQAGLTEIESCYDSALARKASLRGTLKFSWAIDREGKASKLKKVGGSLRDATVERCSLDTIREMQFPAGKKRTTHVIAPLAFQTRTNS